jgi:hypothetical protein
MQTRTQRARLEACDRTLFGIRAHPVTVGLTPFPRLRRCAAVVAPTSAILLPTPAAESLSPSPPRRHPLHGSILLPRGVPPPLF